MASFVIHIAVANELNKKINRNTEKLFIGSIAPDLSKLVGETKEKSHFLDGNGDLPNLDMFLEKYNKYINDDFVLGYYIHLYTDYLWFKYFLPEVYDVNNKMVTKLDGSEVKCFGQMLLQYLYNDYANLNNRLIEEYDLDTSIFYNEIPKIDNIIDEIPVDRIELLINKSKEIIDNSKARKDMVFNIENAIKFISLSVELIYANLKEIKAI